MKIVLKKLEISNYRSCIKTVLDFETNLAVLIGINGAGKSNILKAILLLRNLVNPSTYYSAKRKAVNHSKIKAIFSFESKEFSLTFDFTHELDENNYEEVINTKLFADLSQILEVPKILQFTCEYIEYLPYPHLRAAYINSAMNKAAKKAGTSISNQSQKKVVSLIDQALQLLENISYYSASQFTNPVNCPNYLEIEKGKPIRRQHNYRNSHYKFILDLYYAQKNKQRGYELFFNTVGPDGLSLVSKIVFQDIALSSNTFKVRSGGKVMPEVLEKILIIPNFEVDGVILSPNQLSEGTFRALALIFYLLTDENALLIIEEPEVCIHHGLLHSLVEIIKSRSRYSRIIISTHSEYILDQLKPENIILVKKNGDKGTTAKLLNDNEIMSKNKYKQLKKYLEDTGNLGEYIKETHLTYVN